MTPEERSDISNAIWLRATHADLIDKDEVTYTADVLRAMKREHQANCFERQRNANLAGKSVLDLIAIGPDIVFVGELLGVDKAEWSFHLRNFVDGDVHSLIVFIERYEQTAVIDRYILVNFLGDGRALKGAPSLTRRRSEATLFGAWCSRAPTASGQMTSQETLHYQTTTTS
jgi:hypothetical protein